MPRGIKSAARITAIPDRQPPWRRLVRLDRFDVESKFVRTGQPGLGSRTSGKPKSGATAGGVAVIRRRAGRRARDPKMAQQKSRVARLIFDRRFADR